MRRIVVDTTDRAGRQQYVARAEGSKKEAVADTPFAAQLYAAKLALGIRRPKLRNPSRRSA